MNILIVTQYFYPENFRINDLAIELKKRGHEVTIFTGKPNYPQGKYYEGYSFKKDEDEIWNGIKIYRCPLRARKTGNINLMKNYISFVHWGKKYIRKLYQNEYDCIYVFEVSPITVALPAIKLKKKKRIPIIINVQDLWPDNITAITGLKNPIVLTILDMLVNYIYEKCDLILCSSPSFVEKIKCRKKDKSKVKYWPQFSPIKRIEQNEKINVENKYIPNKFFNITFTGNLGKAQGLDIVIRAAKKLENTNLHWNLIGDGRERKHLEEMVNELGIQNNVTFYGFVPETEIPNYLEESDIALLILKPDPIFEMTIPAKLQTYLACGLSILGCVTGEGKRIIDEAGCGITSDKVSVDDLVNNCHRLLKMDEKELILYKEKALIYSKSHFDKDSLIDDLEEYMEGIKNDTI